MMPIDDKDLLLIDQFLLGELSETDSAAFAQRLQSEPRLQEALDLQKEIIKGFELRERAQVKQMLQAQEAQLKKTPAPTARRRALHPRWAVAAAIALLLGALWFLQKPSANPASHELFATNFKPYSNHIAEINRGESKQNAQDQCAQSYGAGDFAQAYSCLTQLQEQDTNNEIQFYQAISLLALDRASAAIPLLQPLSQSDEEWSYTESARWYLALAYLNTQQKEKAIPLLEQISTSIDYKEKATRLLEQL